MNTIIKSGRNRNRNIRLNTLPETFLYAAGTRAAVAQRGRWKVVCAEDGTLGRYESYEDAENARAEHARHYPDHDTRIIGSE